MSELSPEAVLEAAYAASDAGDLPHLTEALANLRALDVAPADQAELEVRLALLKEDDQAAAHLLSAATSKYPNRASLWHLCGWLADAKGQRNDAVRFLQRCVELAPTDGDAWHLMGACLADIGDLEGMQHAWRRVHALDAADESVLRLEPIAFDAIVQEAYLLLPEVVRRAAPNLALIVEPLPDAGICDDHPYDPRLLGLFSGPTHAEEHGFETLPSLPPVVYIFQRNLERLPISDEELVDEIVVTVLHEVGHWLGLSEEDLEMRGLD